MKTMYQNYSELATEVNRLENMKRDFILPTPVATVQDDGQHIHLEGNDGAYRGVMNTHFIQQLCAHHKLPYSYVKTMVDRGQPELIAKNLNTWLHNPVAGSGPRLFRTYDKNGYDNAEFRSCHSHRFLTFDHFDLLQGLAPVLQRLEDQVNGLQYMSMGLTDNKIYLKIIFPNVESEIKGKQVGDIVKSGVLISNSEVGAGSIVVSPFIYRLICTNGMTVADAGTRRRHLGKAQDEGELLYKRDTKVAMHLALQKQLRDHVEECADPAKFQLTVDKINESAEEQDQRDPEDVIEGIGKKFSLSDGEVKKARRSLLENGDYSRWGFANAVTSVADMIDNYDRSSELQEMGGNVIQLPKRDWMAVAA
tara:strand:- start:56 stop:1150 length:1095 start_codon:yes stop_codon:yes gene_type:complete